MTLTVAVVGGGQLARMMGESASALGITLKPLVEDAAGSAGSVIPGSLVGHAQDPAALAAIAAGADVLTVEHEHVDESQMHDLMAAGIPVWPSPDALVFARDKIAMRRRLGELGVPCPRWTEATTAAQVRQFGDGAGWPVVVKTPRGGYDGKGVRLATSPDDIADWIESLESGAVAVDGLGGDGGASLLLEERIPFTRELAALVARRPGGPEAEIRAWPVVETIQSGGVCSEVIAPAPGLNSAAAAEATRIAETIARELGVVGVLAVEMFAVEDDGETRLYVNELAMRPHNSGHWTIDGAVTSQFEQHLRAVLDLPLGDTSARQEWSVMVNLLGAERKDLTDGLAPVFAEYPAAKVHLYGKSVRPGRKLGHVTASGAELKDVQEAARGAVRILDGKADQ